MPVTDCDIRKVHLTVKMYLYASMHAYATWHVIAYSHVTMPRTWSHMQSSCLLLSQQVECIMNYIYRIIFCAIPIWFWYSLVHTRTCDYAPSRRVHGTQQVTISLTGSSTPNNNTFVQLGYLRESTC